MLISALAAVVGLVRLGQDIAIAWRFGTAPAVDAFYFVANLISWPVMVTLSTITLLVAPSEVALRTASERAMRGFRSGLLGWSLLASLLALPLSYLCLHVLVSNPLAGLSTEIRLEAAQGASIAFTAVAFGLLSVIATAWFVSSNFRGATLLDAVPPASITFAAVFLPTAAALYWGLAAGAAVQASAAIGLLALRGELPRPRLTMQSSGWHGMAQTGVALLAVQAAFTALPVIDQFFAAHIGAGVVSSLNYANRLLTGLLAVIALGLQRAALPLLADWMTRDDRSARQFVTAWVQRLLLAGVPLTITLWFMAPLAVDALYARGSFTVVDARNVAHLVQVGALQLPFYLAFTLLVTALAAMGATRWVTLALATAILTKCVLNAILVATLGASGLQLATAGMYAVAVVFAWSALAHAPMQLTTGTAHSVRH